MILTLGDVTIDILAKPHGPLCQGSDVKGEISLQGGGSAANFASWVAYVGEDVAFIGAIGEDWGGELLSRELEERGIKTSLKKAKDHSTASILLFIDSMGERHMVTDRGASLALDPSDLDEGLFEKADHFHMTAYSFFGGRAMVETAIKALELAKLHQLSISIDPSSYGLLFEFGVERFLQLTSSSNIIFPNLEEGRLLTGSSKEEEILSFLKEIYDTPLLKLGERGAIYNREGEILRAKAPSCPCIDTTGAGDAFAAGFICSYLSIKDLDRACHEAVKLASIAVSQKGGRPPLLSRLYSL